MSSSDKKFEDELADVESLATLVDLRKDMKKGFETDFAERIIHCHIQTLLDKKESQVTDSNAKRIRLLQPIIKARYSMMTQDMDIREINDLVAMSLKRILTCRYQEMPVS